jgi:hypothetical protein
MPITINGSGTITGASTLATTVVSPTLTTPNINSAPFATVSGTAPIYPCRAWVNFNGTGTPAIRASGNVSSITDNGTGDYTVNFTTAMVDANYSAETNGAPATRTYDSAIYFAQPENAAAYLAGSIKLRSFYITGTSAGDYRAIVDLDVITVSVFR